MCCERFIIYPRCGHPASSMGHIYHCPAYSSRGRVCVNDKNQVFKDFDYIIEDNRTQRFVDGREQPISGGWAAEIGRGYKGFCQNCIQGRSEPITENERREFLVLYLGEYEGWKMEKDRRRKLAIEQERAMERFRREKGESEIWAEGD